MNKFKLLTCILIFSSLLVFWTIIQVPNKNVYLHPETEENKANTENIIITPETEHEAMPLIRAINKINSQVKKVSFPKIHVRIRNIPIGIDAWIFYEKDKKFRMQNRTIFGKETDIGSNEEYFWFWSRTMKPRALYYAHHKDIGNIQLKTPFHPIWMMETMGFSEIDMHNAEITPQGDNWMIIQPREGAMGQPVKKGTLIDAQNKRIIGHYLYDMNDNLMASSEVLEFQRVNGLDVISKTRVIWHAEEIYMEWNMGNVSVNTDISNSYFEVPDYKDTIDMGTYRPPGEDLIFKDPNFRN